MGGDAPQMQQRYGLNRPQARAVAPPPVVAKTNEIPYTVLSAQGGWEHQGDKYQIKVDLDGKLLEKELVD